MNRNRHSSTSLLFACMVMISCLTTLCRADPSNLRLRKRQLPVASAGTTASPVANAIVVTIQPSTILVTSSTVSTTMIMMPTSSVSPSISSATPPPARSSNPSTSLLMSQYPTSISIPSISSNIPVPSSTLEFAPSSAVSIPTVTILTSNTLPSAQAPRAGSASGTGNNSNSSLEPSSTPSSSSSDASAASMLGAIAIAGLVVGAFVCILGFATFYLMKANSQYSDDVDMKGDASGGYEGGKMTMLDAKPASRQSMLETLGMGSGRSRALPGYGAPASSDGNGHPLAHSVVHVKTSDNEHSLVNHGEAGINATTSLSITRPQEALTMSRAPSWQIKSDAK